MPEKPENETGQESDRGEVEEKRVDRDWKEEARREKERLIGGSGAAEPDEPAAAGGPRTRALPEPSFALMVTNLALQTLIAMGEIPNPITRKRQRSLGQAKHTIDLLGVLEEKTRGNLTEDEQRHLQSTLYELRTRYLSLSQL